MNSNLVLGMVSTGLILWGGCTGNESKPNANMTRTAHQDSAAREHQRTKERSGATHFRTIYFATPIELKGDSESQKITSIKIICDLSEENGGKGRLLIDTNKLKFNEFGDATKTSMKLPRRHSFSLLKVKESDDAQLPRRGRAIRNRTVYRMDFTDPFCDHSFFLNFSKEPPTPSKLVLCDPEKSSRLRDGPNIIRAFQLTNLTNKIEIRGDQEIGDEIHLQTPAVFLIPGKYTSGITIAGRLGAAASLTNDQNRMGLTDYGDSQLQTLMAFSPSSVQLNEKKIRDPQKLERRLFDVAGRFTIFAPQKRDPPPVECSLVVSPRIAGEHRLIIKKDGDVAHVIPLHDRQWQRFAVAFNSVTDKKVEKTLLEIRSDCGNGFSFAVKDGKVNKLGILGDANDRVLKLIGGLNSLTELRLSSCQGITESGLQAIGNLQSLEVLSLRNTLATDHVLQVVGKLSNINTILIYHQGADLHLGKISGTGVGQLKELKKLKVLCLSGRSISDRVVDEILAHKNLERFDLVNTSMTLNGMTKIGQSLPNCRITSMNNLPSGSFRNIHVMKRSTFVRIYGPVANQELAHLSRLESLKELVLPQSTTDQSLKTISKIGSLEKLWLPNNRVISNEGVKYLSRLSELRELTLSNCRNLTDESAKYLEKLKNLKKLNVCGTSISGEVVKQLQAALPNCQIEHR